MNAGNGVTCCQNRDEQGVIAEKRIPGREECLCLVILQRGEGGTKLRFVAHRDNLQAPPSGARQRLKLLHIGDCIQIVGIEDRRNDK